MGETAEDASRTRPRPFLLALHTSSGRAHSLRRTRRERAAAKRRGGGRRGCACGCVQRCISRVRNPISWAWRDGDLPNSRTAENASSCSPPAVPHSFSTFA
eukprot:gene14898-biopygen23144